jgi:hypothetical protein
MSRTIELLIRKTALKDVEVWLNKQYLEIEKELKELEVEKTKTHEPESEAWKSKAWKSKYE